MATKKQKKGMSTAGKVGIGLGLTAAAVAAAGAYFLTGATDAVKNRKKVKGWMLKAKGEVLQKLEKAEAITETEYRTLVDAATGAYGTMKNATAGEVKDFKREMQDHWNKLEKSKVVKKLKGSVHEAAKKVAIRTAPKGRKRV